MSEQAPGAGIPPEDERDPDQAWYWTPEWQAAEREADEDIKAGRVTRYATAEEFLASLEDDKPTAVPPR